MIRLDFFSLTLYAGIEVENNIRRPFYSNIFFMMLIDPMPFSYTGYQKEILLHIT